MRLLIGGVQNLFRSSGQHSVWCVYTIRRKMWTVFCVKMPVYRNQKHLKNAAEWNVHVGCLVNGHCACSRIASVKIRPFNTEMLTACFRITQKATRAISTSSQLHGKNATMNDANRTGAWIHGRM